MCGVIQKPVMESQQHLTPHILLDPTLWFLSGFPARQPRTCLRRHRPGCHRLGGIRQPPHLFLALVMQPPHQLVPPQGGYQDCLRAFVQVASHVTGEMEMTDALGGAGEFLIASIAQGTTQIVQQAVRRPCARSHLVQAAARVDGVFRR